MLSMMKSTTIAWTRYCTLPSSGRIWERLVLRKQIWKSRLTKVKGKWSNWLPFKKFPFPHLYDTPMHHWDQKSSKSPQRNPLKKGFLSENVMKEVLCKKHFLFNVWVDSIGSPGSSCVQDLVKLSFGPVNSFCIFSHSIALLNLWLRVQNQLERVLECKMWS